MGIEASSLGMAQYLHEVLTHFVLDHHDETWQDQLTDMGLRTLVTGIMMNSAEDYKRLAREVLAFAEA